MSRTTKAEKKPSTTSKFRQLRFNAVFGGTVFALLVFVAVVGQYLSPFAPNELHISDRLQPPGGAYLLGTDEFGRDTLSRLLYGAKVSVWISAATVSVALILGLFFGVVAGFFRGWVDIVVMIFNDALLAFPGILLALGIMAIYGASINGIIVALGIAYTPAVVRVVRASVLSLREQEFVEASVVIGNSAFVTMYRHILPNIIPPLIVLITTMFGWVILSEAALSFLGLGVPPPSPSWGNMLSAARPYIVEQPLMILLPGLCITLTLLGINLLGDALRDFLDPKMEG